MQVLRHISYTWLLAHGIHPIIWIIAGWILNFDTDFPSVQTAFGLSLLALVASIPAIPVFYFINKQIIISSFSADQKFIIWLLSAPLITACNALALMVFIADFELVLEHIDELVLFAVPSVIATVLSVCARYDYFIEHNTSYNSVEEQS